MPTQSLSAHERPALLSKAREQLFDLIVIGGGITGAGIAFDAASRGLSVLLVEMQDFGAGTSSRSTKLIHGGLRYLKQFEIGLVREVGQERAILHQNAPHIVHPQKMLLPIIEQGSLGKYSTSMGLFVYDLLAGVNVSEWRTMHDKTQTIHLEPLLREDILVGGGLYVEYLSDDARLVIEVMKTAAKFGAICLNYIEATGFSYNENRKVNGVKLKDKATEEAFTASSKIVVNAAGPWVDKVRSHDHSITGKHLRLTKGVHIVVSYKRFPLQQSIYFDVKDGRMIFAIPRQGMVYIGTTDTFYDAAPERPEATLADVQYIIDATNALFPDIHLSTDDVCSTWAGLRPLIYQTGKKASELSRKDEIFYSPGGIISIAGGKLTGFRKMAERTVDVVVKELYKAEDRAVEPCITDQIKLSGGNFATPEDLPQYIETLIETLAPKGIDAEQVRDWTSKYGKNAEAIAQIFDEKGAEWKRRSLPEKCLLAELHYGIRHEMVCTLSDFLIRRTGRLYFERPQLAQIYPFLHKEMAKIFKWNTKQKAAILQEFEQEYHAVMSFSQQTDAKETTAPEGILSKTSKQVWQLMSKIGGSKEVN